MAPFARDYVDALAGLRQVQRDVPAGVVEKAEASADRVHAAIEAAVLPAKHLSRKALQIHIDQLHGPRALRRGDRGAALVTLRQAAADETALPYEFGPPTVLKPSNELLGEVLLELGQPAEAAAAFDAALELAPGRALSVQGRPRAKP